MDGAAHVFHPWLAQGDVSQLTVTRGTGSYFWDDQGRRYLDFSSQLVNLNIGHQHPRVVAAIRAQAERLCTVAPVFENDKRSEAARLIAGLLPGQLNKVFFTGGGAEANEHAVRMARLVTGRPKVLTAYRSYHGGTQTALHLSGDQRRWPVDTGAAGVARFFGPYPYRSPFDASSAEQECRRALRHLAEVIHAEGPQTLAAVLVEPVPGTAGILVPPDGYLAGVRRLCDEHGILLIADEVMCGFGRTGRWLAVDHWAVRPDLLTFAKGVNSGYVPLGGVLITEEVAVRFDDRPYPGGLTYAGHPLACAAAVAAIEAMRAEGVVENAARVGRDVLGPGLAELARRHPCVGDVRGLGAFWAIELVCDQGTRRPLGDRSAGHTGADPMHAIVAACRSKGLWPMVVANRLHVAPPCNILDEEIGEGLSILDEVLSIGDAHLS
ncbi:aspartate aminotransferase family protein [Micromonospora sp. FIMYZ51]|uniref:aspartate aminotransferase family protein n=1 Tax=Micromonospora sp. FIMYZ51 TaxID=3051832 RepID=UPI00311FAA69